MDALRPDIRALIDVIAEENGYTYFLEGTSPAAPETITAAKAQGLVKVEFVEQFTFDDRTYYTLTKQGRSYTHLPKKGPGLLSKALTMFRRRA